MVELEGLVGLEVVVEVVVALEFEFELKLFA